LESAEDEAGPQLSSIHDCEPEEQGGPLARKGFAYQDYIAADCILELIENDKFKNVHCETMDDVIQEFEDDQGRTILEFIQVKTTSANQLWTCARLCQPEGKSGKSLFQKSLEKDKYQEFCLFRIVTTEHVSNSIKPLTYKRDSKHRLLSTPSMQELLSDIEKRCPDAKSNKGAKASDWLENVIWTQGDSQFALQNNLIIRVINKCEADFDETLMPDQAQKLLMHLLRWVKEASDAHFVPDHAKKIISRAQALEWWNSSVSAELLGLAVPSGGKLLKKLTTDVAPETVLKSALAARREYAKALREPRYMGSSQLDDLASILRSKLVSLNMARHSGEIQDNPKEFLTRSLKTAQEVAVKLESSNLQLDSLAQGCLFDIVDRCQHDFKEPKA
jgi:hypothetical protein